MPVQLPSEPTKPNTDLSSKSILLYSVPKAGKCLGGGTILYDPQTGCPRTLADMIERRDGDVHTMAPAGVIRRATPADYIRNPADQLYRLTTQTGRVIEATGNHPLLTREGWKPLSDLEPNDRVAVVAEYPGLFGGCNTNRHWMKILAYLIADGSLGASSPLFTKSDPVVMEDFQQAVEAVGADFSELTSSAGVPAARIKGRRGDRNNVLGFLRKVGLDGVRSGEKFIPDFVFTAKRSRLALFLGCLFTCDGSVERHRVSYSSKSIRLVRQVQHLLLRFGIVSVIRDRYIDGKLYGAELYVAAKADILRFIDNIPLVGEKAVRAEQLRRALYNIRAAETQLDRPGAVLFDRIRCIEPLGVEPVYDLEVAGTHNFVANDFIVHNSTFASRFPDALFFECEPGLSELEVYKVPTYTWEDLLEACRLVGAGKHEFQTIVIDTVDNAFKYCSEYVCKKHGVEYEGDLDHGKGWAFVKNEWHRVLTKLASLPYGLILISHATEKEVKTRTGPYTRVQPSLPDRARHVVLGLVDMILYCDTAQRKDEAGNVVVERVIRTKPHPTYEAGDRTGRLPEVMPLDYGAFVEAFTRSE
ncbi:MAG: AAA family ATPase [Phycisphaera sp.]|nr:AAA family ATPase [Phycisphaera sp.]